MDQQKAPNSTAAASPTQTVWGTLTAAQQEAVLRTLVWICRQIVEVWNQEARHEPGEE